MKFFIYAEDEDDDEWGDEGDENDEDWEDEGGDEDEDY